MADSARRLIDELFVPVLALVDELSSAESEKEAAELFACDRNRYWLQVTKVLKTLDWETLQGKDLREAVGVIASIREGTETQCNTFDEVTAYIFKRLKPLREAAQRGWKAAKQGGTVPEDPFPAEPPLPSTGEKIGGNGLSQQQLSKLEEYPATTKGHLGFIEFVRDEVHGQALAKRNQLELGYSNESIKRTISSIKWEEASARLASLEELGADVVEQITKVLRRELSFGTVEQIDEMLMPAVGKLRDAWETLTAAEGHLTEDAPSVQQLLDGPDNAELTPKELALLETYLQEPFPQVETQQGKQAAGEAKTSAKFNKLKLIRDFNRNLQSNAPSQTANSELPDEPWHICEKCIDPLADELFSLVRRFRVHFDVAKRDKLEKEYATIIHDAGHSTERLTNSQKERLQELSRQISDQTEPPCPSEVERIYGQYEVASVIEWLKFNVSVDYAEDFKHKLLSAKKRFFALEFKACEKIKGEQGKESTILIRYAIQRLIDRHYESLREAFPDHDHHPERDELPDELRAFEVEILDEYSEIENEFRKTALYLIQVSALVRSRFAKDQWPDLVAIESGLHGELDIETANVAGTLRPKGTPHTEPTGTGNDAKAQSIERPPENAFKAWRLRDLAGTTNQTELAAKLIEQGVPATQGQVSRWLKQVDEYLKAGNVLPSMASLTFQPQSIDPKKLDMGQRQDGRTPRQRDRRNPDSDDR